MFYMIRVTYLFFVDFLLVFLMEFPFTVDLEPDLFTGFDTEVPSFAFLPDLAPASSMLYVKSIFFSLALDILDPFIRIRVVAERLHERV